MKISLPPTLAGTPATKHELTLTVGDKSLRVWFDDFGPAQPAGEKLGEAWSAVYGPTQARPGDVYFRRPSGASITNDTISGRPAAVRTAKDLGRNFVS